MLFFVECVFVVIDERFFWRIRMGLAFMGYRR